MNVIAVSKVKPLNSAEIGGFLRLFLNPRFQPTIRMSLTSFSRTSAATWSHLTEVRHRMNVERPKSFRISSGYRGVCTTF